MEHTSVPCFPCFIRTTRRSTSDGKGAIPPAATFATLSSPDEHRVAGHVVGNRAQIRKILRFGADRGRKRRAAPAAPPLLIRINPANPNSPHRPGQVGRREAEHAVHSLIRHIGRDVSPAARPREPQFAASAGAGRPARSRARLACGEAESKTEMSGLGGEFIRLLPGLRQSHPSFPWCGIRSAGPRALRACRTSA